MTAELVMSLDVIYHLIEDDVCDRYLRQLFVAATRFVVIYSSDLDEGDSHAHVRHRQFTTWVAANQPAWKLIKKVDNAVEHRATAADFFFFAR